MEIPRHIAAYNTAWRSRNNVMDLDTLIVGIRNHANAHQGPWRSVQFWSNVDIAEVVQYCRTTPGAIIAVSDAIGITHTHVGQS